MFRSDHPEPKSPAAAALDAVATIRRAIGPQLVAQFKRGLETWLKQNHSNMPEEGPSIEDVCYTWGMVKKVSAIDEIQGAADEPKAKRLAFLEQIRSILLWSVTKAIIILPKEIVPHIEQTVESPDVPMAVLKRLPQWSVFYASRIHVEGLEDVTPYFANGFFVSRSKYGGQDLLVITLLDVMEHHYRALITIDLTEDRPLKEAAKAYVTSRMEHDTEEERTEIEASSEGVLLRNILPLILNMILFTGSQQAELHAQGLRNVVPRRRGPDRWDLKPVPVPVTYEVGTALLPKIREIEAARNRQAQGARSGYLRRAHWHGYWTGPKMSPTDLIFHWIPPTYVRGSNPAGDAENV